MIENFQIVEVQQNHLKEKPCKKKKKRRQMKKQRRGQYISKENLEPERE
jgi:hypothetical protein